MEVSEHLTWEKFWSVVEGKEQLYLGSNTRNELEQKREQLLSILQEGKVIYGVNTGVGSLKDVALKADTLEEFQANLIRSHAESVGQRVSRSVTKGAMVLLAHSLAQGLSGVSPELLERILFAINMDYIPRVGCFGSVGASGDLSFLATLMLGIVGEKPVYDASGNPHMLEKFALREKEGLAVINGTHFSLSHMIHLLEKFKRLEKMTRWTYALHLETRKAIVSFHDPLVSQAKPDPYFEQLLSWLREVLKDSSAVRRAGPEVQEPYVIRCFPQLYAPVTRTLDNVDSWLEQEMNIVSDNPLFKDSEPVFQGNFHAESIAVMSSQLRALLPLMGNILYQLQEKLLNPEFSRGLPAFLAEVPGLNSGLMIVQYLSADLLSEISMLASPITIMNQTMSTGQEDVVSFAPTSNRLLERQLELYKYLLASTLLVTVRASRMANIEVSTAIQEALEFYLQTDVGGERSFSDVIEAFADQL